MILKVHRSNFFMGGFVDSPTTEEIAALAHQRRLPFVEDLGSGAVIRTDQIPGLEHEPTPAEVLKQGADLVTFSGDKLLGGPQAGIIAGKASRIAALKREPFYRALRCDKLVLSALQATVEEYLNGRPEASVPVVEMLRVSNDQLQARAERVVAALAGRAVAARVGHGKAQIGGGTLPRSIIDSVTVDLIPSDADLPGFAARLRDGSPPVIAYITGGRIKVDLRTVFPGQDDGLVKVICAALPSD